MIGNEDIAGDQEGSRERTRLPSELFIHIATFSSPSTLIKLERLCQNCFHLIQDADSLCWKHHALSQISKRQQLEPTSQDNLTISSFVTCMKDVCIEKSYWDDLHTWKAIYRQAKALQSNWDTSKSPKTRLVILGFNRIDPSRFALPIPKLRSMTSSRVLDVPYATQDSSYVWRARLDPSHDANFILTTWHTGGLKCSSADPGQDNGKILWELPNWSVRPYAHLEYSKGVACWDGENGIEVWKRWKLIHGIKGEDEPANKRGQFVKVITLPDLVNTRGFMLNDDLHLTICSSDGHSQVWDLSSREPIMLNQYSIPIGAAGHLEHDDKIAVYSLGQKGYTIYDKELGLELGRIDLSEQSSTLYRTLVDQKDTNFFSIDSCNQYAELASQTGSSASGSRREDRKVGPPRKTFVTMQLERGGLPERMTNRQEIIEMQPYERTSPSLPSINEARQNAIDLHQDSWGAAMIRRLDDGATILVARSRGGRVMICTDLLRLLSTLKEGSEEEAAIKVRQCIAIIECGGRASRTEFYTGGWLTCHNGRAAWEVDNQVYIMPLPEKQNTLPKVDTFLWMLPSLYDDEIRIPDLHLPISFMSLHDDVFMSTYLHPSYILVSTQGHTRWETTILKSVRLIHFSSFSLDQDSIEMEMEIDEEEEEDNIHPLTNANKALHRRWDMTGRRLAQAALEEAGGEWSDEDSQDDQEGDEI